MVGRSNGPSSTAPGWESGRPFKVPVITLTGRHTLSTERATCLGVSSLSPKSHSTERPGDTFLGAKSRGWERRRARNDPGPTQSICELRRGSQASWRAACATN